MSKRKFTEPLWCFQVDDPVDPVEILIYSGPTGAMVAKLILPPPGAANFAEAERVFSDADLITAAPELLEALELAYAYIGSIQGHADIHSATALYLKLQKTIAKARGES